MTTDGTDFENIQVGNNLFRIPSSICSDKEIFQNIFSMETWNTVLKPDQKERIMKMLPVEIRRSPGADVATIEDLLTGNLTRFNVNPLESFFNELNIGGYDPEVAHLKYKIKHQWRKDLLRRKRDYHTKLMQDVIISSQSCLQRLRDKKLSKSDSLNYHNTKSVKSTKVNHQDLMKPTPSRKRSNVSKPSPLRQKVAKRLHNEILAMNIAFPSSCNSSEESQPSSKKALLEKKPTKSKKLTQKSFSNDGTGNNLKTNPSLPGSVGVNSISSSNALLPNTNINRYGSMVIKPESQQQQSSIQMAKFPTVIPPSLLGVINVTQGPAHPKQPYITHNPQELKVLPQKDLNSQTSSSSSLTTPQGIIQKHTVLKSSPILASQLQAPIVSSRSNSNLSDILSSKEASAVVQSMNQIHLGDLSMTHGHVHGVIVKAEEESSSEDEFEAIEPTIGFSTTMFPTIPKIQSLQTKSTNVKSSCLNTRVSSGSLLPKNLPMKPKSSVFNNVLPRMIGSQSPPTTTMGINLPKAYHQTQLISNVNVKVTNSKAIITTTQNLNSGNTKPSNLNINSMKMISGSSNLSTFLPSAHSSPGPNILPTVVTNKLTSNLLLAPPNSSTINLNSSSAKLLPISISNLTQALTTTITTNSTNFRSFQQGNISYSPVSNNLSTTTTVNGPSSLSLHPNSLQSTIIGNSITTNAIPNSLQRNLHSTTGIIPIGTSPTVHVTSVNSSSTVPPLLPIPLTLSDLSLSLNLGLDVTGDKLEDKIDDLSVLDGNAFDSIPNLSDDLDVFDLDLVDGLCDFEVMLNEEKQYSSFFALIREVLCSTQNHRMTLACLEKTVRKWATSPTSEHNSWFMRIHGWNEALMTALNFLAGNYQEIHPEDFVPYIEYKYKTKYYQWIGAGRDNDTNLLMLCNIWLDNLDKLPPVKKQDGDNEEHEEEEDENEDSDDHTEEVKKKYLRPKTPPPPRFITDWTVRASTGEEKEEFQVQEKIRFDNPHKAFTYRMHMYESVVGPVKGVYSNQTGVTNKARGHSLLVDDRPPYVTILALVRDSVARLPNGEGTRSEICEMLRDSAFLAPEASNVTLNSVVSGALDRLHYERDPCVRYDSHKKNWIYLHRDRSQEQFERLHHNRSYTKSTKSRNSNGRKSRKKTLSQSSTTTQNPSTSSTADSSAVQSSSSSVSSTPSTTPTLSSTSGTISTTVTVNSPPPINSTIDSPTTTGTPKLTSSTVKTTTVNSVYVSATSGSTPTIQFALPVSSGSILLNNKNWIPTNTDGSGQISANSNTHIQSLPNVTHQSTTSTSITQIPTINLQTTAPSPLTQPMKALNIKLENPVTVSSAGLTNSSNPTLQQQSFILNNIFRLPNLKLPENVRFMRLQQNPTGQLQGNQLRIPQQRIVLRQAFPGHVPGQGVILGQTPTGQTVIISAIGSPQATGVSTTQGNLQQGHNFDTKSMPLFSSNTTSTSPILTLLNSTSTTGSSNSTLVTSSNKVSSSPVTCVSAVRLNQGKVQTSSSLPTIGSPTASIVRLTSGPILSANRTVSVSTSSSSICNMTSATVSLPSRFSTTQPNLSTNSQFQTNQQQNPASVGGSSDGATQLPNSPMVIRSSQLEYLIPGHHLSLGRGMQGIKVIPVQSGSQIFARLVAPGQAVGTGTVQNQTPTIVTQAQQ